MKKTIFTFAILLLLGQVNGQPYTGYDFYSSGNTLLYGGNTYITARNIYLGPTGYAVAGPSFIEARAAREIHLQPELHIAPDPAGFGHFLIDSTLLDVVSYHPSGFSGIPTYCRYELGIELPAAIQSDINAFLNVFSGPATGINPYDPDQIKVECVIKCPSGNICKRYGFYFQLYAVNNNEYFAQPTDHPFRIRFAPPEVGSYTCDINIYRPGQSTITRSGIVFSAISSGKHGNLVMAVPQQKMKFDDGTAFFGMGQNFEQATVLTYTDVVDPVTGHDTTIHNSQDNPTFDTWLASGGGKASPATQDLMRQYLIDLANKRGNFARLRLNPWNCAIEYKDKRTDVTNFYDVKNCINNYQPNQMFLWEFDRTLDICEQRDIYTMLCVSTELAMNHAAGLVNWEDNPYSWLGGATPANQFYASPAEQENFYASALSRATFKKQMYYVAARWGYSTNIAMWEMINETESSVDYSSGNIPLKSKIADWVCEMSGYLKSFYPAHLSTNGTASGDFFNYMFNNYPCLDIYSGNDYSNEIAVNGSGPTADHTHYNFKDSYHEGGYVAFGELMPFVHGEIGLGVQCVDGRDIHSPGGNRWLDPNLYNDRNFHNNLWSTTVSSNVATGLNYFDSEQPLIDHRANFRALSKFVNKIRWNKILKPQRYVLHSPNYQTGFDPANPSVQHQLYNLYMMDTIARNYAVGWSMIHPSFWTYDQNYSPFPNFNDMINCLDYDATINPPDYNVSPNLGDAPIVIKNMLPNKVYKMRIFDPYDETIPNGLNTVLSDNSGTITFHLPFYNHRGPNTNFVGPDRAYIIYDNPEDYNPNPEDNGAGGQVFQYVQEVNNGDPRGKNSPEGPPKLITFENGVMVIKEVNLTDPDKEIQDISIYPNPSGTVFNIAYSESYFSQAEISVYDLVGNLVQHYKNTKQIDAGSLDVGVYLLKFKNGQFEKTFKITVMH